MPKIIDREEVQRLRQKGTQIVDVLPKQEYEEQHLPGAVSIPLKEIDTRAPAELDRDRPVITYCWDFQ
jgi:rhodanese-related sulfurtransferase